MSGPQFIGLSTGRAGSRYLAELLNAVGVKTLHEVNMDAARWVGNGALGEVSAHFVTQMDRWPEARVWHFSRHPQPFVSSLMKFGFWAMNAPSIHPYLRRTGDLVADSFRYWIDWNRRILEGATPPRRVTFRIEDINADLVSWLAHAVGIEADVSKMHPGWNERREPAPIPPEVECELIPMMETLGYAPRG